MFCDAGTENLRKQLDILWPKLSKEEHEQAMDFSLDLDKRGSQPEEDVNKPEKEPLKKHSDRQAEQVLLL